MKCIRALHLIVVLVLTAARAQASVNHFSADARLGNLSQHDIRIFARKISNKKSDGTGKLCGPTCAVNVFRKLWTIENRTSPFADPIEELGYFLQVVSRKADVDGDGILKGGITFKKLAKMIRVYLKDQGLAFDCEHLSVDQGKSLQELVPTSAAEEDSSTILAIHAFSVPDPMAAAIDLSDRVMGHAVNLAGSSTDDPSMLVLQDPSEGIRVVRNSGYVSFKGKRGLGIWIKRSWESDREAAAVVTEAIILRPRR